MLVFVIAAILAPVLVAGCTSSESNSTVASPWPLCPVKPIDVVVSVDQWGSLVRELAGACAKVTSIVSGSSIDPHDYELSPADASAFTKADLVIINGGGYDEWARKAAANAEHAALLDIVGGAPAEMPPTSASASAGNPHVWYSPTVVVDAVDRITTELTAASPEAATYFTQRRLEVTAELGAGELATVGAIRDAIAADGGRTYGATEWVFDPMAGALGLTSATPIGFVVAERNGGEPSPGDVSTFIAALNDGSIDVLIVNTQTSSALTDQLRRAADQHGVPVVEVSETIDPHASSFDAWQTAQLVALARALRLPGF